LPRGGLAEGDATRVVVKLDVERDDREAVNDRDDREAVDIDKERTELLQIATVVRVEQAASRVVMALASSAWELMFSIAAGAGEEGLANGGKPRIG
jgi:hypothetical protein